MKETIAELDQLIDSFYRKIESIPETEFADKPLPEKWSKKEVVGHLIDSAQNNLRRFISGQYEREPKIFYDQDFWVMSNGYQAAPSADVLTLWRLVNRQIIRVLGNMDASAQVNTCDTGKTSHDPHTLKWLAEDYVKHLKHHLNQIIPGSFELVYQ